MGYVFLTTAIVLLLLLFVFLNTPPPILARLLRTTGPLLAILFGLGMTLIGRGGIGLPVLMMGAAWWARNRKVGTIRTSRHGENQTSTVRSAWLEMQLDHESGELDGLVLAGQNEGKQLSELSEADVLAFYDDLKEDAESAALLEAYLDRRIPAWREDADTAERPGHGSPTSSGPMTKEEAYQVLGLAPGASTAQIRSAHRKLMKAVHPDSGGSTFLAARINKAKDTLLD